MAIASVARALQARIQGSGGLVVRDGDVESLEATISGSGSVAYGGTTASADLSVMGSGSVRVKRVTRTVRENSMGSGKIEVWERPSRDPDSFWS